MVSLSARSENMKVASDEMGLKILLKRSSCFGVIPVVLSADLIDQALYSPSPGIEAFGIGAILIQSRLPILKEHPQ